MPHSAHPADEGPDRDETEHHGHVHEGHGHAHEGHRHAHEGHGHGHGMGLLGRFAARAGHGDGFGDPAAYERMSRRLFLGRRDRIYDRIAQLSGAGPGQHALDLGSGTGALTQALARRVGPSGQVIGVDPSVPMVDFAASRAPANIRYAVHSATSLPLPDASVDIVTSALVLHHLEPTDRAAAITEAARVLRPGGRILLVDAGVPAALRPVARLFGGALATDHAAGLPELLRGAGLRVQSSGRVSWLLRYAAATRE